MTYFEDNDCFIVGKQGIVDLTCASCILLTEIHNAEIIIFTDVRSCSGHAYHVKDDVFTYYPDLCDKWNDAINVFKNSLSSIITEHNIRLEKQRNDNEYAEYIRLKQKYEKNEQGA